MPTGQKNYKWSVCLYQDGNIRGHCATFAWPDVWSKCKASQAWPALELLPCNGDNERNGANKLTHPNTATTIRSQPDCIFPRPIFAHGRSPRFNCHSAAHATCFFPSDHWITKITKTSLFPNDIVISKRPPNEQNSRIKHCGSYGCFWFFVWNTNFWFWHDHSRESCGLCNNRLAKVVDMNYDIHMDVLSFAENQMIYKP